VNTVELFLAAGVAIFALGIAVHLLVRDLIRRIVTLNVASGGVMLVFLALADRRPEGVAPDPVPQALVLTGIVVMAAITGLALALARRIESTDAENEAPAKESGP
jgi:multicomponent Na+:H+ antiporter subunit C